jgi:hypothetical protein
MHDHYSYSNSWTRKWRSAVKVVRKVCFPNFIVIYYIFCHERFFSSWLRDPKMTVVTVERRTLRQLHPKALFSWLCRCNARALIGECDPSGWSFALAHKNFQATCCYGFFFKLFAFFAIYLVEYMLFLKELHHSSINQKSSKGIAFCFLLVALLTGYFLLSCNALNKWAMHKFSFYYWQDIIFFLFMAILER